MLRLKTRGRGCALGWSRRDAYRRGGAEQAGTVASCGAGGASSEHAWYEIVPAPPITANLHVSSGDLITASVNILDGGTVALFQIKNRTTRTVATTKVSLASMPDLTSAEWIAEAPTSCILRGCFSVPLPQFGSVSFSKIAALGNDIGGTPTRPDWSSEDLQLVPSTAPSLGAAAADAGAGAVTSNLTPAGRSFQVFWVENPTSWP